MKNKELLRDLKYVSGVSDGGIILDIIDDTVEYIEYLEGKEDRCNAIESVLNKISESDSPNKDIILAPFKEFYNEET
jgi:hypothetical protein